MAKMNINKDDKLLEWICLNMISQKIRLFLEGRALGIAWNVPVARVPQCSESYFA